MCNETRLRLERFPPQAGLEPGPLDQQASALPTELPGKLKQTDYNGFRKQ